MTKVNVLRKHIENMKSGDSIHVNAIGLTIASANLLKDYLKKGVLIPDSKELKKFIKPEYLEKYLNGDCICPQMTYIKW